MFYQLSLLLSSVLVFQSALAQDRPEKIPIRLSGFLLDDDGNAVSGGKLQIWQTDTLGIYDHPWSMNIEDGLDPDFQYYGTATSGEDGSYSFLTIRPEHYPARPESHIHFKIFVDDALVLTTQLYFRDENHPYPDSLQLDLTPHEEGGFSTEKNISVNLGGGGSNPVTPSQASGPYYPVVDFFDVGNNLILSDSVIETSKSVSGESDVSEEDVVSPDMNVTEAAEEKIISSEVNDTISELAVEDVSSEDTGDSEKDVDVSDSEDVATAGGESSSSSSSADEGTEDLGNDVSSAEMDIENSELEDTRTNVELIVVSKFALNSETSACSSTNGFAVFFFATLLSWAYIFV